MDVFWLTGAALLWLATLGLARLCAWLESPARGRP